MGRLTSKEKLEQSRVERTVGEPVSGDLDAFVLSMSIRSSGSANAVAYPRPLPRQAVAGSSGRGRGHRRL